MGADFDRDGESCEASYSRDVSSPYPLSTILMYRLGLSTILTMCNGSIIRTLVMKLSILLVNLSTSTSSRLLGLLELELELYRIGTSMIVQELPFPIALNGWW
jgi:hypothetical protein